MRNRLMSTAHEPAYSEDGMPKERYRLDHVEKLREGSLRMTRSHALRLGPKNGYVRSLAGLPFIRLADEPSLARRDLRTCKVAEAHRIVEEGAWQIAAWRLRAEAGAAVADRGGRVTRSRGSPQAPAGLVQLAGT